jgi:SAM-dependent methyltransferase
MISLLSIMHPKITYDDIDWKILWQNARKQKSWTPKGPKDWDKKAPSFLKRNSKSPFVDLVLARLPLQKEFTVLDAGSGPGTLSLPLAKRVQSVTALDYSQGMLDALETEATKQGLDNIRTINGSWDDDWDQFDLRQHDICIASRSLSVPDLQESLTKLNNYSCGYVFVVDRVSHTPFDCGAFEAVNRPFRSGPDYIYTVNTLYSMGIHCSVDIISLPSLTTYKDIQAAMESYRWMFKDLTPEEENNLRHYILTNSQQSDDGQCIVKRATPPRWAIISWKKEA